MLQRNDNAAAPPCSLQRTMCPNTLDARGLAASVAPLPGLPRSLLLVSAANTSPVAGCTAIHSGRSIRVAPARSAACRVRISTSACELNPFAPVRPCFP